jgi:hypothetical protein
MPRTMANAKNEKHARVGRTLKNYATGRVEVRKDALYSFTVPAFEGWTPRSKPRNGSALKRK